MTEHTHQRACSRCGAIFAVKRLVLSRKRFCPICTRAREKAYRAERRAVAKLKATGTVTRPKDPIMPKRSLTPSYIRRGEIEIIFPILLVLFLIAVVVGINSCTVIAPGTVGVQVTFGSVNEHPLTEGAYALNPLSSVHKYDLLQKTWKEEKVTVPSQDQLVTTLDVSVQYRLIGTMTPQILRESGTEEQAIAVHMEPKLRSALREVGKSLVRAEDFFSESTQVKLQTELLEELAAYCKPKGIEVQAVLLRDIVLPPVVAASVQAKKQREQLAIQQQAELARFTVEQQQKIATAEAEKTAAGFEADKVKIAADAEAYRIQTINAAASTNPVYVQLQALKTLGEMAKDPATKLYFLDGHSTTPLPLLHLGDGMMPVPPVVPAKLHAEK